MAKAIIGLLLILGSVFHFSNGDEQFHRETKSSKANRLQRQIHIGAYPISLNQHYAAAAVEDGKQAAQNTQLFLQHLSGPQSPLAQPQQIQYVHETPSSVQVQATTTTGGSQTQQVETLTQYIPNQSGTIFIDQFGQLVQVSGALQQMSPQNNHVIRLVDQYGNLVGQHPGPVPAQLAPVPQQVVAHTPVVHHPAPVFQQFFAHNPVFQQQMIEPAPVFQQVVQPAHIHHHIAQPAPIYHEVLHQTAPVYQHEVVAPQPIYQQVVAPAPVFQQFVAPPAPVVHETVYPAPIPQIEHQYQPLKQFIPQAQPFLHFQKFIRPEVPIAQKVLVPVASPVVPVVHKTIVPAPPIVKVEPELHIIKQPILPPAVFQKQIFALKNPPLRVLTYSDLCTVYPYQRKLRACVIKKGQLPELHHPDIQLVSEQSQNRPVPSVLKTPMILKPPTPPSEVSSTTTVEGNIQDILRRGDSSMDEGFLPLDPKEENPNFDEDENYKLKGTEKLSVESSNKKEKQVKKLRILRITTAKTTSTTSTEVPTSSTTTTTKKPKRRSTKRRSHSRRQKANSSSTTTSTTERPFGLA